LFSILILIYGLCYCVSNVLIPCTYILLFIYLTIMRLLNIVVCFLISMIIFASVSRKGLFSFILGAPRRGRTMLINETRCRHYTLLYETSSSPYELYRNDLIGCAFMSSETLRFLQSTVKYFVKFFAVQFYVFKLDFCFTLCIAHNISYYTVICQN